MARGGATDVICCLFWFARRHCSLLPVGFWMLAVRPQVFMGLVALRSFPLLPAGKYPPFYIMSLPRSRKMLAAGFIAVS